MNKKQAPITDDQRKVLEIKRDHPGSNPKDIVSLLDDPHLGVNYVQQVIHNFELKDQPPKNNIGNLAIMTTRTSNDTTDDDEQDTTKPDIVDSKATRTLDSLGKKSKRVIKYVNANPETGYTDLIRIMEDENISDATTRISLKKFSELVPDDAAVWDGLEHPRSVKTPDDIRGNKQKQIVKYIINNPEAPKARVAKKNDTNRTHVTATMQTYNHLLPDAWCERFPSLTGGGTLPHGDGDDTAHGRGGAVEKEDDSDDRLKKMAKNAKRSAELDREKLFDENGRLKKPGQTDDDDEEDTEPSTDVEKEVEEVVAYDAERVDMLWDEIDSFEGVPSEDMELFSAGMRHVLSVLELDRS